jgi:hypothetical protein
VHDPVFDLSVDPHVCVEGVNAEDKCPRGLVLQDTGVDTVVMALRGQSSHSTYGIDAAFVSCKSKSQLKMTSSRHTGQSAQMDCDLPSQHSTSITIRLVNTHDVGSKELPN